MAAAWTWIVSVLPLLLSVAFAAENPQPAPPVPPNGITGAVIESGSTDGGRQTRAALEPPSIEAADSTPQSVKAVSGDSISRQGREMPAILAMFTSRPSVQGDLKQNQAADGRGQPASADGQRGVQYGAAAVPASLIVLVSGVLGFVLVARRRVSFIGDRTPKSKVSNG